MIDETEMDALRSEATEIRRQILSMAYRAGSGHCGGSLSCVEILLALYRRVLRVKPKEPEWPQRDRLILSKGHAAPALYAVLARSGFFPESWLATLRQFGSPLQGHPDMKRVPGVDLSSGSLGMGISAGIGMAWAARRRGEEWRVFVVVGDGEMDEGQNWEAAMLASKLGLSNLIAIVDCNGVQLDGPTEEIMPLAPLDGKLQAFGWGVRECDGHEFPALLEALEQAIAAPGPQAVIARTVKGKGIDFMEGKHKWHGAPLSDADYRIAMRQLEGSGS